MSIQPPNGILDITGATLRVSKMEFSNVTGFDTVLNNVARNTVLHVDTTEYTANVAYAVKPPNMFMAQFDLELAAGGTGLPCNFNYYNDSNLGTSFNGYNLSFNDTSIILTYDGGSALHTATLSSSLNNGVYRKVKVLFDRDTTLVSINGENVFRFKDELRPRTYDTGTTGYIRWWHNSPVARKIKNLKVSNGEKWAQEYDSAGLSSNISYTHGLVGVGTSVPEYTLDVAGDIRASGNLIINGSNTLINTTSLAIEDGVIECGKGNSSAAKDLGFLMVRNDGSSTTNSNVAMFWDESTDALTFGFSDSGPTATTLTPNTTKTLNSYFVGNVGIGTASPESALDISSTSGLMLRNTSNKTGVDDRIGYIEFYNGETGGGNRMSSAIEACVNAGGLNNNSDLRFKTTLDYNNPLIERMRIDRRGNVGIGTNPEAKLDVFSSSTDPGAVPTLHVGDGAVDYGDYGMLQLTRHATTGGSKAHAAFIRNGNTVFGMGFHNNTNTFGFWPSFSTVTSTPAMSFQTNGNVGIGTTSPGAPLHINDSTDMTTASEVLRLNRGSSGDDINSASRGSIGMYLQDTANPYEVARISWQHDGADTSTEGWGKLGFWTSDTASGGPEERMTIDKSGKIGIGTASPREKFHLYGSPMIQHETRYSASSNQGWYKLGTWDAPDASGSRLKISLLGGESYSAQSAAKGGETIIYASINNNNPTTVSNMSGSIHAYGNPVITQAKFKQVGTDRSQYEIYAYVKTFTQHSMKIECTNTSTFTRAWTGSTDPGADSSTVQAALFTHVVDNVGHFGIGTTNPTSLLHIVNPSTTSRDVTVKILGGPNQATNDDSRATLELHDDYNNAQGWGGYIQGLHRTGVNHGMGLGTFTNGSKDGYSMFIRGGNGRVGIGTASPDERLHVYHNSATARVIIERDTNSGECNLTLKAYHSSGSTEWQMYHSGANSHLYFWRAGNRGYLNHGAGNSQLNFTGQHRTFIKDVPFTQAPDLEGLIVSADQNKYIKMSGGIEVGSNAITTNESIPIVTISARSKDKKCFGVISASEDPETREEVYGNFVSISEKEYGDTRVYINSVGEGAIWVTNINGNLESGDYITTSNVAGYGMKQDSEFLANYTVAKITMDCDFAPATQPIQRILKELSNVNYWVTTTYKDVALERYSNLTEENRQTITTTRYSNEEGEISPGEYSNLESNVQATYSEIETTTYQQIERTESKTEQEGYTLEVREELVNVLDEHGQLQWEDHPTETEKAYKIRYLDADGKITTEANKVHTAAFVGCTYHCG